MHDPYRGLILDFGGVLTTQMRLNGEAFERSEGLAPGAYFSALESRPDGIAVYAALEIGQATQEDWNRVIGDILGIDPTDLMQRALANLQPEPLIVTQRPSALERRVSRSRCSATASVLRPTTPTLIAACGRTSSTR
ncbi:hypothetical protein GCM10029976_047710 [Kribbella albertanoniae]|uniref:hypothetical protein n=1 Tax=Kribbella albertanoniae TaxID=1266829 RepID=UPI00192D3AC6|nr:hypothetical protein [Kribbella albertanoniae]